MLHHITNMTHQKSTSRTFLWSELPQLKNTDHASNSPNMNKTDNLYDSLKLTKHG